MLSILIKGSKQAGIDIDVFLEPLMEDMAKTLERRGAYVGLVSAGVFHIIYNHIHLHP
jgi:hypothetical protein